MKSEVLLISVCLFVFGSAHYQDGALTGRLEMYKTGGANDNKLH